MITMSSLTKEATEPFVYSMLDGDALTAVEHLEFPEFALEGGENVIFTVLEARYRTKIRSTGQAKLCSMCSGPRRRTVCGLSDDQRAVVLGRTGGKYEIAAIAPALRPCQSKISWGVCVGNAARNGRGGGT